MTQFVPYQAAHLHQLVLQDAQVYMDTYIDDHRYAVALEQGESWSAIDGDKVLGAGGLIKLWDDRAMTWTLLATDAGKGFPAIHKFVRTILNNSSYRRIEATVDCNFPDGHRWVKMLGFKLEAERMRAYRPDGGDCSLYAIVRP